MAKQDMAEQAEVKVGYAKGIKYLTAGTKLYIVAGAKTGYNGGGIGANNDIGANGGGATHIAINYNRGELFNYVNNKNEILIVAGGGGGRGHWGSAAGTGGAGGRTYWWKFKC